jgi:hypothetical protein
MTSTYFSQRDAQKSGKPFAQPYLWEKEGQELVLVGYMGMAEVSGAGCNISNVVDYTKWIPAMINMDRPMSQKGHEMLVKPHITFDYGHSTAMPPVFCGLGWFMLWYQGEKIIFQPGGLIGFADIVIYLLQRS